MTGRRDLRELDTTPPQPWRERSSPGIRRMALQAAQAAVRAAKQKGNRR